MGKDDTSTKDKVLRAAAKQFAVNGYDGTTTRSITAEAGANVSAIPIYFKTKENLYKEALEHTVAIFHERSMVIEKEFDDAEKRGLINRDNAWDYIVELIGNLVEWIFDPDFYYEKLLLNRELLSPSPAFSSIAHPVLMLYWRFEMLSMIYTDNDDRQWAKHFSFMTVQTLFSYGNYPEFMEKVTERNMLEPDTAAELKADVKRDMLTAVKAVLRSRRIT